MISDFLTTKREDLSHSLLHRLTLRPGGASPGLTGIRNMLCWAFSSGPPEALSVDAVYWVFIHCHLDVCFPQYDMIWHDFLDSCKCFINWREKFTQALSKWTLNSPAQLRSPLEVQGLSPMMASRFPLLIWRVSRQPGWFQNVEPQALKLSLWSISRSLGENATLAWYPTQDSYIFKVCKWPPP